MAPEAETALERIVLTIELQRYARPGSEQAAILKADAETVIAALDGGVTRRAPGAGPSGCRGRCSCPRRLPAAPTPAAPTR